MRTTHPLAPRIKKLLQSDEEVGRINMHTPHVGGAWLTLLLFQHTVSRTPATRRCGYKLTTQVVLTGCAVEELIRQLCSGAAAVAKDRGLKTVTAPCLYGPGPRVQPALPACFELDGW